MRMRAIRVSLAIFSLVCHVSFCEARWEVVVIFLASQEADAVYQQDIDENMLELARKGPRGWYRLSVYREFSDRSVYCSFEPDANVRSNWGPLFFKTMVPETGVPCKLEHWKRKRNERTLLHDPRRLRSFLQEAFALDGSRRLLMIYNHGRAFEGLRDIKLKDFVSNEDLETHLTNAVPERGGRRPLDLLWFDSCFGANLESAYQLRNLSDLIIGSEDAEFSSASPLETLRELENGPEDSREMAKSLAKRFIESYSSLMGGKQADAVVSHSATISVIETERLEKLVAVIGALLESLGGRLTPGQERIVRLAQKDSEMRDPNLVDLGFLLLRLRDSESLHFRPPQAHEKTRLHLTEIARMLEINREKIRRKNPRVAIRPPEGARWLVFGYEDWNRGDTDDPEKEWFESLPGSLRAKKFIAGKFNRLWPAVPVSGDFSIAPYLVGFDIFNFFFADEGKNKIEGTDQRRERKVDFSLFEATRDDNPILFLGHTHGLGRASDRYTGLTVLKPSGGSASIEYVKLDFARKTGWGNL